MRSASKAKREIGGLLIKVNKAGQEMMKLCVGGRDRDTRKRACAIGHRLWKLRKRIEADVAIASLLGKAKREIRGAMTKVNRTKK